MRIVPYMPLLNAMTITPARFCTAVVSSAHGYAASRTAMRLACEYATRIQSTVSKECGMTEVVEAIAQAALKLPAAERAVLIDQLLRSLDRPDPEIDRAWAGEVEARIDAIDRGEMALFDADAVLTELRSKLRQA
jgi:putative addiction module component (TIGR02574 family)